ncbi:MAG TPA: hypothetical protein VK610_01045, partial [Rhodothermales bacterium]|nr:hypothetical protein [Rhodothermales bacterium]
GKARWIPLPLAVSAEHELVAYPDQISGDEAAPMGVMVQRLAGGPAQIVAVLPEASPFIADELEARFDGCTVEVSAPEGFEGPTFRSRTTLRSSLCPD